MTARNGRMKALAERLAACPCLLVIAGFALLVAGGAAAAGIELPGVSITTQAASGEAGEGTTAVKILLGLTGISLAPAFLIAGTSFTRFVIRLALPPPAP